MPGIPSQPGCPRFPTLLECQNVLVSRAHEKVQVIRHEAGREKLDPPGVPLLHDGLPDSIGNRLRELSDLRVSAERKMEDSLRVGVVLTMRQLRVLWVPHRRMLADGRPEAALGLAVQ